MSSTWVGPRRTLTLEVGRRSPVDSSVSKTVNQPDNAIEMDDADGAMSAHPASSFVRRFSEQISVIGREPEEIVKVYDTITTTWNVC
jgi:flagellar basal body P-ring protein FlgI